MREHNVILDKKQKYKTMFSSYKTVLSIIELFHNRIELRIESVIFVN